ncbi:hypothetical protein PAXRUDRAFT_730497 [Paxillus rubicundulus Ve08.2h10]|uniref:G domain-containing protein n=1 Tax=Paxillus rubicundulus Ve08.2h10 TaxID=930991 RepID=A0A0D0DUL9_9AGAM|nr:hypothetical protein PAXRUDRAFT_730497 [Paxillus rubicundulus Ve08.2h10]
MSSNKGAYVVVVVGRTGMGISSLVNLIIAKEKAQVNNNTDQCTTKARSYETTIDNKEVSIYDIPGLGGGVKHKNIITSIVDVDKKRGIDLLINCLVPKDGIVPGYYSEVVRAVGSRVPIAAVVTRLEREHGAMENWWSRNGGSLESQKGMKFVDHACVTTLTVSRDDATWGGRKVESERAVRALISKHCRGPKRPPRPK